MIALLAAGCSSSEPPRDPDTLAIGVTEPASLLPAAAADLPGRMITSALWTPLSTYDPDKQEVTPVAASAITSTDNVAWTIRLRPGRTFHDGTPVTAASYVGAWQASLAEHWPGTVVLTDVLGVRDLRAADEATISLTLSHPVAQTPLILGSGALFPLPSTVLSSRDWAGFARHPIGDGPYRLDGDWQPGRGARLTRVAPGGTRTIDLRVLDPAGQYSGVRSGAVDLATSVPGSAHDAMNRDFADRHLIWALPGLTYLSFPLSDKRFADPVVRHAIALAIDRGALEAGPLDHQVDIARSLLPPSVALAQRPGPCRPCTADPAAAKDLLSQSGALTGPVTVYTSESWGPALADQLHRNLGLDVTARGAPPSPADGPVVVTRPLFSLSPREPMATLPGYTAPAFTDLLTTADAAPTPADAGQLYRLAENQVIRDLPVAPLWSPHAHAVWASRLTGLKADPYRGIELDQLAIKR